MLAVQNGHTDIVQSLIDQGAQVDLGDRHLRTALHRAVSSLLYMLLNVCLSKYVRMYMYYIYIHTSQGIRLSHEERRVIYNIGKF